MSKKYVKQHIVPKRYLDRFASNVKGKSIIGTRLNLNNRIRLFESVTSNVGYIDNFYDVYDKEDEKHWEKYFAKTFDYLCGEDLERIISKITLSKDTAVVLDKNDKAILSRIIVAQMMRIPQSIDAASDIYHKTAENVKNEFLNMFPNNLKERFGDQILKFELAPQWIKEDFFNKIFDPKNFENICKILSERTWVVYVNIHKNDMPFVTSDNPVLVESMNSKTTGIFNNSLSNVTTSIFFPLTPTIAVANYAPNNTFLELIKYQIKDAKIVIDDIPFVMSKNIRIISQAFRHSFIPQPVFSHLVNNK